MLYSLNAFGGAPNAGGFMDERIALAVRQAVETRPGPRFFPVDVVLPQQVQSRDQHDPESGYDSAVEKLALVSLQLLRLLEKIGLRPRHLGRLTAVEGAQRIEHRAAPQQAVRPLLRIPLSNRV